MATVLLVDAGCSSCEQAMRVFSAASETDLHDHLDFLVLADHDVQTGLGSQVTVSRDLSAHAALHPGWSPALLLIDPERGLISTEPAGSDGAVQAVLDRSRSFARARYGAKTN